VNGLPEGSYSVSVCGYGQRPLTAVLNDAEPQVWIEHLRPTNLDQ